MLVALKSMKQMFINPILNFFILRCMRPLKLYESLLQSCPKYFLIIFYETKWEANDNNASVVSAKGEIG